jgi:hypothetical protein
MGTNGFREDELVSRRVKVGNDWQTKVFPIIGGRLRIIHETCSRLNIATEILKLEPDFAVVRATLESEKGKFCGTGTASAQRDARLADSLVELAETRSIARALRFGGIGVEFTSAEEVSHVAQPEPEREHTSNKGAERVFHEDQDKGKRESKASHDAIDRTTTEETELAPVKGISKPQSCGIGLATQAQCRALYALTKRAQYTQEDIDGMLSSMGATAFQDLSRESASQLIGSLQAEVAA